MGRVWVCRAVSSTPRTTSGMGYSPVTIAHEIESEAAAANKEQLHQKVVQRHPVGEEVKVARHEYPDIEGLRFE